MASSHTVGRMAARHIHEDSSTNRFLTVAEVADQWGTSVRTIQRYIKDGELRAMRLPRGHYRIYQHDVDAALRTSEESA